MTPLPIEIKRDEKKGLTIVWRDGSESRLTSELLRRECPCATCRENRGDSSHAKPLTAKKKSLAIIDSSLAEELELKEIWGVGQYALGMLWGDGHNTGIYPFSYLYELSRRDLPEQ